MAGNIYRFDPQPTQGQRFVPIPQQGDQPPRRNLALTMALVMASWPTGMEHQPQQRLVTVPIPVQGDQPPRQSRAVYSPDWYRIDQPQQRRSKIAALISTAAEQPAFTRPPASILRSWEPEPAVPRILSQIAPLTLAYGDTPPPYSAVNLRVLVEAWQPPPPLPQQQRRDIAPLTLVYGDLPPIPSRVNQYITLQAWTPPDPQPQRDSKNISPLTLSYGDIPPIPSRVNLYVALQWWVPPDPQPQRDKKNLAPLTLIYGDSPPPYSTVSFLSVVRAWEPPPPLPQQQRRDIAPLTLVYGDQPPVQLLGNRNIPQRWWVPPDPLPQQQRRDVAPLTLVYGDQPPPISLFNIQTVLRSWQQPDIVPQRQTTFVPAVPVSADYPFAPFPWTLIQAWQVEPWPQQQRVQIAPLTIIYGDQPPRQSRTNLDITIGWWNLPEPHRPPALLKVAKHSGLVLWLKSTTGLYQDVAATTIAVADADTVALWQDQSGQGNHFKQTTGSKQPTLRLDRINGLPAIRFDGVDDSLTYTGGLGLTEPTATVLIVAVRRAIRANAGNMSFYPSGVGGGDYQYPNGFILAYQGGGGFLQTYRFNAGRSTASPHPGNDNPYLFETKFDGVNNTAYLQGTAFAPVASTGNISLAKVGIGNRWAGIGTVEDQFDQFDVAEIRVWNTALSDSDRTALEADLLYAYGINQPPKRSLVNLDTVLYSWQPPEPTVQQLARMGPLSFKTILGAKWVAGQNYLPGFQQGEEYIPGFQDGEIYLPGFEAGQKE